MVNGKFDFPCSKATFTMRNNSNQFALPVRRYTKDVQVISMGYGVGGMGAHYAGAMGKSDDGHSKHIQTRLTNMGRQCFLLTMT